MSGIFASLFPRAEPTLGEGRAGDAAALADLHSRAFRHGWSENEFERLLADRNVICHVVRAHGIAGFVISRMVEDEAEILMVAVAPQERGRGLGGKLIARHLARLAAHGVRDVFLEVDEGNDPAIRLYTHAGFERVGRRPAYYEAPNGAAAALILRRRLD